MHASNAIDLTRDRQRSGTPSSARPLRLLLISPSWPAETSTNGIVVHVDHLFREFKRLGQHPLVATPHLTSEPAERATDEELFHMVDAPVSQLVDRIHYRLRSITPVDRIIARRIRALVKRLRVNGPIDVLQVEESWGIARHLQSGIANAVSVRLHGPWFLTGGADGVPQDESFRRRVRDEGAAIKAADSVSAPSAFVLKATQDYYQFNLPNARVIPNCARLVPVDRRWRGDSRREPLVLFVGRFDAIKGADVVLQAFTRIQSRVPDARLIFIGPTPGLRDGDGQLRSVENYLSTSIPSDVASRIEFLGRQSSTAIQRWRQIADVTVIASRFDNFPNTALEAIACGSPTVATAVGGIPEIISDGRTGLLVPPESPDALAEGVVRLLDDRSLAARLGQAAAIDAETRFHPLRCAEQMLDSYRVTLDKKGLCA
jgi:glycosyltransferase involved in cell wall biosynthesis